jgi:hypothetical protein
VRQFERNETRILPEACRENARRFDRERFRRDFRAFVETRMSDRRTERVGG